MSEGYECLEWDIFAAKFQKMFFFLDWESGLKIISKYDTRYDPTFTNDLL